MWGYIFFSLSLPCSKMLLPNKTKNELKENQTVQDLYCDEFCYLNISWDNFIWKKCYLEILVLFGIRQILIVHTKAIEVITGKQCYKPPSLCCSSWFPSWLTHPPAFIVSDSTRQWKHLPSNNEQGVSWTARSKCVCIFKPSELFLPFLLFYFTPTEYE